MEALMKVLFDVRFVALFLAVMSFATGLNLTMYLITVRRKFLVLMIVTIALCCQQAFYIVSGRTH